MTIRVFWARGSLWPVRLSHMRPAGSLGLAVASALVPLSTAVAQADPSEEQTSYVAPAAAADESAPVEPAPAAAAPAAAAPAAAAPAASAAPSAGAATVGATATASGATTRQLSDIAVTGSALGGTTSATALPVSTYSKEQLIQQGITSTEQALAQIPAISSSTGAGAATGTAISGGARFASLRSLPSDFTLVLLNGKRLPLEPFNGGAAVDINQIPFAAIERVEVLRDGASALYGSDAVAGVINFITDQNLEGGEVALQYGVRPEDGGGNQRFLSGTWGTGNLEKDRYNVLATFNYRRQDAVSARSSDFVVTRDARRGIDATSSFPIPASYGVGQSLFNPAAPGCGGPLLSADGDNCRFNFQEYGNIVTPTDQFALYTDGTYRIADEHDVSLSYLYSANDSTDTSAPGLTSNTVPLMPSSPFFPGNAQGPAISDAASDFDPTNSVPLRYRNAGLGPRITENENRYHHAVLQFEGRFERVDYDTAFTFNQGDTEIAYGSGYFNPGKLAALFNDGTVNPFARLEDLTAAERSAIGNTQSNGTVTENRFREYIWDGQLSRELGNWFGGGQVAMALGSQYRHQLFEVSRNGDLLTEIAGSGGGLSPSDPVSETRDIGSLYSELNVPLLESLEVTGSFRYDNYDDVGDTVNPKVTLRYQPFEQLVLRGSYAEGFAAPTLSDLYDPTATTFTQTLNDPRYCDDQGNPSADAPASACNNQFMRESGGNTDLDPQTSKSWTLGFVTTPIERLNFGVSFWWIQIKDRVSALSPNFVLDNPGQFADNIIRDPVTDEINLIRTPNFNLGSTYTNGVDFTLDYTLPVDAVGTFALQFNGTLTNKYDFKNSPDSDYTRADGRYQSVTGSTVPDWKHLIRLSWVRGPVFANLTNNFFSGYDDYAPELNPEVNAYTTFDVSTGYRFDSGMELLLGSQNVLNQDPVFSNQPFTGYRGYNAAYSNPIGRTVFGRVSYEF